MSPDELRRRLRDVLTGVGPRAGYDEQADAAEEFVALLGRLGLTGDAGPEQEAFIDETAPRLEDIRAGLAGVVATTQSLLLERFLADEWRVASERRTGLQFLHEFYRGRADDVLADVELDGIDDLLHQRAPTEGFVDHVPDGVPDSHWWWRRPR